MRYAWEGDFVDNTGLWKGKPNSVAKVGGKIFYRNNTLSNIRVGNREASELKFKGYQLIDRYPEFHYTIDGLDVYELIKPDNNGAALIRTFRIPSANEDVWFYINEGDGVSYESSAGKVNNKSVVLTAEQARNFSIVMTKKKKGI